MSTELAPQGPREVAAPNGTERRPELLDVIRFAVQSPDVDVAKMRELVELQERMERRNAEVEFNAALARVQAVMPRVAKRGVISVRGETRSRYALLEDIDAVVRPLLNAEGFAVSYDSEETGGKLTIRATLSHRLGHSVTKSVTLALDNSGAKGATQISGSTISYGRRYLLCMHLNIITVDEDNDGRGDDDHLPLDPKQVAHLRARIAATRSNEAKFVEMLGYARLEEIQRGDFAKANNWLDRKEAAR